MSISAKRLWWFRNHILITDIVKELKVPHKTSEGFFRFLCPLCDDFHTATNTKTNLGRCFRCKKNFNPIDFVIAVENCRFLDAIEFLEKYIDKTGK